MKIALGMFALLPLAAQQLKLPPNIENLGDKAREVVDVSLDGPLLQLAARFMSDRDPDQAHAKKLIQGLKGIYVKTFEFDERGQYQESDLEPLRAQLKAPGWSRIVGVKSRRGGDNAEIYLKSENGAISGLAIISAEPRELAIVQIIGPIQPEDVRDLGGQFGIPHLDLRGRQAKED